MSLEEEKIKESLYKAYCSIKEEINKDTDYYGYPVGEIIKNEKEYIVKVVFESLSGDL